MRGQLAAWRAEWAATRALVRWVWNRRRNAVLRHVVPVVTVILFAVVQAEAVVDFHRLSAELHALPAPQVGVLAGGLLGLFALAERRSAVGLLWSDTLSVAWRQPVPDRAWSVATGVVFAALCVPTWALAVLFYGPTGLAAAALWCVAWSSVLGAATLPGRRTLWAGPVWLAAVTVIAAGHALPSLQWLFALLSGAAFVALWGSAYRRSVPRLYAPPRVGFGRARGWLSGLVIRDLLVVWRTDRTVLLGPLTGAPLVGAVVWALHHNGGLVGGDLGAGAVAILAMVAVSIAHALDTLCGALGRRLDPPQWPISVPQRALALAVVAGLCLAPSWAAAAVAAPELGLAGHARVLEFVVLCSVGGAWFVAARHRRVHVGSWLWWVLPCAGIACARWTASLPIAGVLTAGAWWGTVAGLRRRRNRP